jgi:hypothetical protein
LSIAHTFSERAAWRAPFGVTFYFDRGDSPVAPALRFRERLEEKGFIRTLDEKIADVPRTAARLSRSKSSNSHRLS